MEERVRANEVLGKTIVSEETGRKFGVVADVEFVAESGELLNLVVGQPTKHLQELNLKTNEKGQALIPCSAIKSVGDYVIVSENELL